ncbi:pilin [Patescibacteria group bacterium]|nr:pilin [Patescibacteria group bacterium]
MKKNLIALSLIAVVLCLPFLVSAQIIPDPKTDITLDSLIHSIQDATWKVFGLIALIMFVVAGVLFLTAGGDPEKVGKARQAFLWGVAGVIVGILAYSIITFVTALL